MAIVVDASAVGAIAFGDPEGPTLAAHLAGHTLIAPSLIDYELASIALKKLRRSHSSPVSRPMTRRTSGSHAPATRSW